MKAGDYYKLCTIERKYEIPMGGHSTLIYKANDGTFIFFDPNTGAETGLDKPQIKDKITQQKNQLDDSVRPPKIEIVIMDNKKFLEKHHSQFISGLIQVETTHQRPQSI